MEKLNDFDYEQLTILIEKLIEKKVREILNNNGVESSFRGTIVSVEPPNAVVRFPDGIEVLLPNNSGVSLEPKDKVIVYGSQTNIANRYIGAKLN
jgi:hypothetical protein